MYHYEIYKVSENSRSIGRVATLFYFTAFSTSVAYIEAFWQTQQHVMNYLFSACIFSHVFVDFFGAGDDLHYSHFTV